MWFDHSGLVESRNRFRPWLRVSLVCALFVSATAHAADGCEPVVGRLASANGSIEVQRAVDTRWNKARLNETLCEGDSVRTAERSRAAIALTNTVVLRLDQNTTIRLINIGSKPEERSVLDVLRGAIQSFSRKPRPLAVNTPYLNGTIEGTEFVIRVAENQTILTVFEGTVRAANEQGSVAVPSGQSVSAEAGKAPQPRTIVRPRDAAQWALYYPPVLAAGGAQGVSGILDQAAQSLSVGRVDSARAEIEKALAQDPKSGLALALRSVIHVVQNDKAQALADGQKAVELAPDSAAAYIALSYAHQAHFDLPAARAVLLEAVKRQPNEALAWARLAELELMMGERKRSAEASDKAVELAPNLSRAYLARGFAALTGRRIAIARAAFEKAIALDSADPLPHLGLGIATINTGDLKGGRQELEVAVAMDSNNALFRAYLGKAYFEEKRGGIDAQQLAIAKEMDPQDPTAYFYNAIRLQTENQPVTALNEVNDSIERNDNRAVYRSRLLLDSDEAARSAGLARVYNDLGFQQLALVEGWKSVNTDPSDAAAHRFLADSYSALPRHEVARVSELLQSQLLDPLNLAPIQPRAAESSLGLISAGGPAVASANEFNSLFKRNQANVILNGMVGELGTASGEAVVAGIYNNLSLSVGASHFKTDGYRVNNDQKDTIGNVFIQAALSPDTSVQFEYRHRQTENGDLNQHMDGSFSAALRGESQSDIYRVGLRQAFSPSSILLVSAISKNEDRSFSDEPVPGLISIDEQRPNNKAFGAELRYLYRAAQYGITAGGGYFDLDETATTTLIDPFFCLPPAGCSSSSDFSAKHNNAYIYSNVRVLPAVTLTLGASWDSFDSKDTSLQAKDQTSPKLGVTWQVQPDTTLRAARFRMLKRSLITDQTLEPTQVAGFNQFYNDTASTDAWRSGIALDQKFGRKIFGGLEVSRRDLETSVDYTLLGFGLVTSKWQEDMHRAYLFVTPTDRLALSIEYIYERLDRPVADPFFGGQSVAETTVHKVPLGIQYFSPSGWTAGVKGTYVQETYESGHTLFGVTEQDSDFWLVDAMVNWRLPQRKGFLAVGVTNLFDKHFAYEQLDARNPALLPSRMFFGRVTLNLP